MSEEKEKKPGLIYVMDMESSLSDALVRRMLDMNQRFIFRKWDMEVDPEQELDTYRDNLKGIIISGSAKNIYSKKETPPAISPVFLETGVPVLGICYGMQLMAHMMGQKIIRCWEEQDLDKRTKEAARKDKGEQGVVYLKVNEEGLGSRLFAGLGPNFPVWMKHNWMVEAVPEGWTHTASTKKCEIAAMEMGNLYAVQFHPEPHNSLFGRIIINNFLYLICDSDTPYF